MLEPQSAPVRFKRLRGGPTGPPDLCAGVSRMMKISERRKMNATEGSRVSHERSELRAKEPERSEVFIDLVLICVKLY